MYKILDIYVSTSTSFSRALIDMTSRANKGVVAILGALWSIKEYAPDVFLKLFCKNYKSDYQPL